MAFTVTVRHSGNSVQISVETLTTDSATPTANSLLLLGSAAENDTVTTTQVIQTPVGGGWSYTKLTDTPQVPWDGSANFAVRGTAWSAPIDGTPSAHTITVDHFTGTETAWYCAVAADVTGHDTADPILQVASDGATRGAGNAESGTVTLGSTPAVGNLVVAWFFAGADGGGGFATPTIGGQAMSLVFNQDASFTQASMWQRTIDGTEASNVITCTDLGQSVGAYTAVAIEILAEAGAATTVILDGALPALQGSFTINASADVALAGTLPALIGDFAVTAQADVQLSGTLPTLQGSFTVNANADVQLAGTLPALEGSFTIGQLGDVVLDGILLALQGLFDVVASSDVALAGALPALEGSFTIATPGSVVLDGALPILQGSFTIVSPTSVVLNGTLPALTGSFLVLGPSRTRPIQPVAGQRSQQLAADQRQTQLMAGQRPQRSGTTQRSLQPMASVRSLQAA